MNKQHLRHPRIQRAFVRWFKRNNRRFAVPIRVTKATSKGIELRFINYPDCLSVWLSRDGLGTLSGNTMTLIKKEEDQVCTITAKFSGDAAELSEDNCSGYHGAACGFSGTLKKVK